MPKSLTAILRKVDGGYFTLCPKVDIASQEDTIEEAKANLKEPVNLFFECASPEEIEKRLGQKPYNSTLEVEIA